MRQKPPDRPTPASVMVGGVRSMMSPSVSKV
jgi:hypothetical protein